MIFSAGDTRNSNAFLPLDEMPITFAVCFRDPRDKELVNYDKVHFFILTRLVRVVTVQMAKDIKIESEVDKKRKDRFMEVFGRGIDERRLVYGIVEWREV